MNIVCIIPTQASNASTQQQQQPHPSTTTLQWRQGKPAPETLGTLYGTATVAGGSAYVSRHFTIYEYRIAIDSWSKRCVSQYQSFSLAVIHDRLTTVGGISREQNRTQSLHSLSATSSEGGEGGETGEWEELYPPVPTHRVCAAVLTTPTHLVVAGGRSRAELCTIEVLDTETSQWSTALSLPEPMGDPLLTLCSGNLYVCQQQQASCHTCPLDTLLRSCRLEASKAPPPPTDGVGGSSEWTRLANTPTSSGHGLATLAGQVLLVGGQDDKEVESAVVHGYDHASSAWVAVGEVPTARTDVLAVVVPTTSRQELVVIGGWSSNDSHMMTEIASIAPYTS